MWNDTDNDGVRDAAEVAIAGVLVELYRDDDGDGVADSTVPFQTDTTDGDGFYLFTGLAPGKYVVVIPAANFASGAPLEHMASSTGSHLADADTDNDDSGIQALVAAPTTSSTVTLSYYDEPSGETFVGTDVNDASDDNTNLTVDFGFFLLASLGDTVWDDVDRDGVQDTDGSEPGVDGVVVKLLDNNGVVIATTTTAGGGRYLFGDLIPGQYEVEFVTSTLPIGYLATIANSGGSEDADSDGDPATGRTGLYQVVPGGANLAVDFGIRRAQVDLQVAKVLSGVVRRGQNSTWLLTVSNNGLDPETGMITLVDNLPAELTFVSAVGTDWTCSNVGQVVTCESQTDLAPGSSLPMVTVVATVSTTARTQIVNGASVASAGNEATPANNIASASAMPSGSSLPRTGAAPITTLLLAGAALAVGVVLVGGSRRRRGAAI